jgi:CheY-like chemotaxis protein
MDGFQMANYIRKKMNNDLPIIAMTVSRDSEDYFKCFEVGMNQFIKKPFRSRELLQQLCSFFELTETQVPVPSPESKVQSRKLVVRSQ